MKLKDAGLPQEVMDQTPKLLRGSKLPILKVRIGNRVMSLICDEKIFDSVPTKKEVKASVSGIYVTEVKGLHGKTKAPEQKKQKAQSLDELLAGKTIESIKRDARAEVSNEGAKDGVEDGEVTDPALALKANMYARKVAQLIRGNWNIPSIISPAELKTLNTEIFFRITFDGGIYDIKIGKSSGNKIFDSSVIEAIRKTGKLPLPEDKEFRKLVLKEGFVCPFSAN